MDPVFFGVMERERPAGGAWRAASQEGRAPEWSATAADEAALHARYARRVWLYGFRHLRDRQAAEDLAQDVLALVIVKLRAGEIREPERLDSFVLGVCRMLVRNQWRGDVRRRTLLERFGSRQTSVEPEEWRLDVDRLVACLQALGERARAVTVLTFYAEQSAEEIARDLALSPANVRVIRHRALQSLAACLETTR